MFLKIDNKIIYIVQNLSFFIFSVGLLIFCSLTNNKKFGKK
ncbi:putative membrane protein [Candidatus Phytoplasma solani]